MSIKKIRPYDYQTIAKWYYDRKLTPPSWADLSETGWIADGRVAGWLLVTNSSVAMIEHLISDPHTLKSSRQESIRKLVGFLVDMALLMGYTNVVAASRHESVAKVAKQFGFQETNLKFYLLTESEQDDKNNSSYRINNTEQYEDD